MGSYHQMSENLEDGGDHSSSAMSNKEKMSYHHETTWDTGKKRFLDFYRGITVEPIALFYQFAIVSQVTIINEYITWAYDEEYITGNYTSEDGKLLPGEVMATTYSADFVSIMSLVSTLPPLFLVYFYGAASDTVGRKRIMIIPTTGLCLALLVNMMIIRYNLTTNLLLFSTVLIYGSGGHLALEALEYAYISDITPPDDHRTMRFLCVKGAEILALTIGQIVGGELITNCGYFYAMLVMFLSAACAVIYTVFFLKDRMPEKQEDARWKKCGMLRKLPKMLIAKDAIHHRRLKMFVFSYIIFVQAFYYSGGMIAMTLFLINPPIDMSADSLAYFLVVYLLTRLVGTVLIIIIQKLGRSQYSDYRLIGIGLLSALFGTIGISVPYYDTIYIFLVPILGFASSVTDIICRSAMSKLVSPSDQGAISAWATLVASVAGLIGATLLPYIYSATFTIYVPSVFCIASAVYASGIVLLIVLYLVAGRSEPPPFKDDTAFTPIKSETKATYGTGQ